MSRIIAAAIATCLLGACGASFTESAGKAVVTAQLATDVTYDAFLQATEAAVDAGLVTNADYPAFRVVADGFVLADRLYKQAARALLAEDQELLLDTIACLVATLKTVLRDIKDIAKIDLSTDLVKKAIALGEQLVAGFGGKCS